LTAPVVAVALLFWACVFLIYFTSMSTTPSEFFFGRYEPPPPDLGIWQSEGTSSEGLLREQRYLLPGGRGRYLVQQVRYRDPSTRQIVSVEPERRILRRKVSSRGA
jgi:hypothetical protein